MSGIFTLKTKRPNAAFYLPKTGTFSLFLFFLISHFSAFTQCTFPNPYIVSSAPFWTEFDVDGNSASNEFGLLHYGTGSKIIAYSSLVNVYVSAGNLVNVPDGVTFDGTEDFSGSGEYFFPSPGDWQIVFKYIPDGRLGFLNFTVTNDGLDNNLDSIYVTRYGLQVAGDADGIIAGDCLSLGVAAPVEFSFFKAQALDQTIQLEWATEAEINNVGFDVQRSTDGTHFSSIGWRAGQGFSNQWTHYTFIDEELRKNITYYYRIVNRDFGGGGKSTPIVSARIKGNHSGEVSEVFPNPVFGTQTTIQIEGAQNETVLLSLYNGQGQKLYEQQIQLNEGPNRYPLEVGQYPSGPYFVVVQNGVEVSKKSFLISR